MLRSKKTDEVNMERSEQRTVAIRSRPGFKTRERQREVNKFHGAVHGEKELSHGTTNTTNVCMKRA